MTARWTAASWDPVFSFATWAMGAGSVPTHRKTSGALYHRLPEGNMPRRHKFQRTRRVSRGLGSRRLAMERLTLQAEIFPYSSLSSPSRAYISRSDTWNRRAVPPLLL